ncbi:hypothetical protein K488DRAFT_86640 [Vararia minispora EC-137]|uniref:Uncharacterized protein n=1 Tax=Vararia minispora EC-137 TaxID=1314806 RepID=A0ACB8QIW9_9AGAM|nr:hypothetical protein K488DRAFT_86640 [Vararia minispora EC-137]
MATVPENQFVFDLSSSYGAILVGAYLSCAFWGINVMQAYMYYWNYEQDSWFLKSVVAFLLVADTAGKILITKAPWFTLVQNWGRVSALATVPQEALHVGWVGYIIIGIVQFYYIRRIVKCKLRSPCSITRRADVYPLVAMTTSYARSWWLWLCYLFFGAVYLSQFPLMIVYLTFTINKPFVNGNLSQRNVRLTTTLVVVGLVIDAGIAAGMLILLREAQTVDRRFLRSSRTANTIRRLTIIVVNTGLLTVIINFVSLLLRANDLNSSFWAAMPQFPAPSAYISAFLANLNARHFVRGEGGVMTVTNVEDMPQRGGGRSSLANRPNPRVMLSHVGSGTASSRSADVTEGERHIVVTIDKYSQTLDDNNFSVKLDKSMDVGADGTAEVA